MGNSTDDDCAYTINVFTDRQKPERRLCNCGEVFNYSGRSSSDKYVISRFAVEGYRLAKTASSRPSVERFEKHAHTHTQYINNTHSNNCSFVQKSYSSKKIISTYMTLLIGTFVLSDMSKELKFLLVFIVH